MPELYDIVNSSLIKIFDEQVGVVNNVAPPQNVGVYQIVQAPTDILRYQYVNLPYKFVASGCAITAAVYDIAGNRLGTGSSVAPSTVNIEGAFQIDVGRFQYDNTAGQPLWIAILRTSSATIEVPFTNAAFSDTERAFTNATATLPDPLPAKTSTTDRYCVTLS